MSTRFQANELAEAAEVAAAARGAVLDRIRAIPARTVAGALVKLRAINAWAGASEGGDSYAFPIDPREVMQVIRDLERI